MYEYIIPAIITLLLAAFGIILAKAAFLKDGDANVDIIIDGNDTKDNVERTVITAKTAAQKHFPNANIYIRGGDKGFAEALCKTYNITFYEEKIG